MKKYSRILSAHGKGQLSNYKIQKENMSLGKRLIDYTK